MASPPQARPPKANPNVPVPDVPLGNQDALTNVCLQLRQGMNSLAGHAPKASPYDRAVTFNDLVDLGLITITPAGPVRSS